MTGEPAAAPAPASRSVTVAWFAPGVALGLALAGLLLWLGLSRGSALGGLSVLLFAGLPLALGWLLLGVAPLLWAGKRAPRWAWGWLLAPPLLAVPGAVTLSSALQGWRMQRLEKQARAFPPASEIHINLSGHDLMPDGLDLHTDRQAMPAHQPERFLTGERWRDAADPVASPAAHGEGYDALYGAQTGAAAGQAHALRLKATRMRRWLLPPPATSGHGDAPPATGQWAPLQAVQPPPALPEPPVADAPDAPDALAHDPDHPDEAHDLHGPDWRIQWLYIHYPAHTEVAPVIARPGLPQALHRIRLHNGGPDAIVRWQINGQEVLVSRRQASLPGDCDADTGGYLRAPAPATQPQTWQLRWQTLAAPGQWQQAEVQVPALAADSAPPAALTEQAVALHRQPDGRWLARRVHRHGRGAGQQVHATALPEPLACGPSDAEPAAP